MSTGIPFDLTERQAERNSWIQKRGYNPPDVKIFASRKGKSGLFMELKEVTPYKLNGELKKSDHLEAQLKSIESLRLENYEADFVWSFAMAKEMIDKYFE